MRRIMVFDTTLRDGVHSPGVALDTEQRLQIAHRLARLGVDAIEAGFPASGPADLEAVGRIAREVRGPMIKALARARAGDVELAWQAVRDARRPAITIFVPTSDIQIEHVLGSSREDVLERTAAAIAKARSLVEEVEFSPMDATRADAGFLADVVATAIDQGASIVSVPDTVGYATPDEFGDLLRRLREAVPTLGGVVLGVHCHNDLGLAVANSLAGVLAGARSVECTVNGLGARAGNTSLEEFVMLLDTRGETLGARTGVNTAEILATSRLVSELTGYAVQYNKAIVGRNAFAHATAQAVSAVRRSPGTYEIMDPAAIGLDDRGPLLDRGSSREALRAALQTLGVAVAGSDLDAAFARFQDVAARKRHLTALDLELLVIAPLNL